MDASQHPRLEPTIISAPFGNYIQPQGATATLGTFTAQARSGRLWRILKTVRYHPRLHAWSNKIGLRNPGIDWLRQRVEAGRCSVADKLVSIHGFDAEQWNDLLQQTIAMRPLGIELNMSCPNVGEIDWPNWLFERAMDSGTRIVVKLPPVNEELIVEQAWAAGVRCYHCCNTLPVPAGGLSGKPLKPLSLRCLRALRQRSGRDALTLIGGGGISTPADIDDYVQAGADHIALGTITMNPLLLATHRPIRPLIDHARQVLATDERG